MFDMRPIMMVIGALLLTLAAAMLVPAAVELSVDDPQWETFVGAAGLTGFVGAALVLSCRGGKTGLSVKQAFVLTTLTWVALPTFAALPLAFSPLDLSYTDAFFEAMSGLTTTGSTVIVGLDFAPRGVLLWRALLQWLGGVGIIVTAVAVLPILRVGGMQLFRMESSEKLEKMLPRAAQIAVAVSSIYLGLTALCAAAYALAGMDGFDAVAHAMTTVATGGFSTYDRSLAQFESALVDGIAVAFMAIGGLPFVLLFQAVRGRPLALWHDQQVRWFAGIVAAAVLTLTLFLVLRHEMAAGPAVRLAAFNAVSVITGTGYANTDYGAWGGFAVACFLFMTFIGGCAGSTSCAIKVFRFQVLFAVANAQMKRLLQPHAVHVPHFNRRPIGDSVAESVIGFFFLFALCFAVLAALLNLLGLDLLTSVSGAATAIANVGPGLGEIIGPAGSFAPLPDAAKWLLAAGMLLGRLELFTVLVMLTGAFWRA